MCGAPTPFHQFKTGYRDVCGRACAFNDPARGQKIRTTTIDRFGSNRTAIVDKIKSTNQQRYGVDFTTQIPAVVKKTQATKLERYGDAFYVNIPKAQQTNLLKFGVPHVTQNVEFQTRVNQSVITRRSQQTHLTPEQQARLDDFAWIQKENETKNIQQIAEELGVWLETIKLRFRRAGVPFQTHYPDFSRAQQKVGDWLTSQHITYERNNRTILKPKEIDLWIPEHRLAIEYSGVYWHSYHPNIHHDERRYRMAHHDKLAAANALGIRLIQFWDTEWLQTPNICQDIILQALGRTQSLGARTCTVIEVDAPTCEAFFDTYHIQGSAPGSIRWGLQHPEHGLVMVMSLCRRRFDKQAGYELIRCATQSGLHIQGGASRLFRACVRATDGHSPIVSYANLRLFSGALYPTLGFQYVHTSPPGYQYVYQNKLYSRLQFQKHKLKEQLETYDPTQSEAENMFRHGYRRLWDAGHAKYLWTP